jgi:sporulation protein YlmC with PRC-barrel domain
MRLSANSLVATLCLTCVAHAQSTPPASGAPQFITIGSNAILSSRLIGLNVQTGSGEGMGKIEDVVFEGGEMMGIVVSVGEVLGSGARYVAVDPSAISIRYVEGDHRWQATMNATREQLKSAPEFRYEGKWKR